MTQVKLIKNRASDKFEEELNEFLKMISKHDQRIRIEYRTNVIQFPNDCDYVLEYSALVIY